MADRRPCVFLRRALPTDISFIIRTEQIPAYRDFIDQWNESQHLTAIADPDYRYFLAESDGIPVGFAISNGWRAAETSIFVKRLAVTKQGGGYGRAMMSTLIETVFAESLVDRLRLGCFPENLNARRSYEAIGFKLESVARGCSIFRGKLCDELIMAFERSDWKSGRADEVLPISG